MSKWQLANRLPRDKEMGEKHLLEGSFLKAVVALLRQNPGQESREEHGGPRTDLASVSPLPTELLTLVSQKMCVVVYPDVGECSGTEMINEGTEE